MTLKKMTMGAMLGISLLVGNTVFADTIAVVNAQNATLVKEDGTTIGLVHGDRIKVLLNETDNEYVKVDMNGAYGYIPEHTIALDEVSTTIIVEKANVRKEPEINAEIINHLSQEEKVTAYYKYANWYYVETKDGEGGFIYKSQLETKYLQQLPSKTLPELNIFLGNEAPVEVITWSQANRMLPRGGTAVIEDVYTGKNFSIKRTFGTNHADIETLTKQDTMVMRSIWGGFTWERRPVIVHINGRRLAASMAGMPHAGKDSAPNLAYVGGLSAGYGYGQNLDAVKGNGMSGVCDLHFRGSRKHKDGRISATVDPSHQRAINIAATYQ